LRPGEVMAALDTPEVKHPERTEHRPRGKRSVPCEGTL
jgi:hypothetical protein